jgi:hypothetical protein
MRRRGRGLYFCGTRSRHCFRVAAQAVSVEHNLDPLGDAQFVKNAEEIVLYCVFGQAEALSNLAIRQAFGHATHHFLFAAGKQVGTAGVNDAQRQRLTQCLQQIFQLSAIGPDLALADAEDALGQLF